MYRNTVRVLSYALAGLCALAAPVQAGEIDALRAAIATLAPGADPDSIKPTPVPGLYEVAFGPTLVYISEDGRYMVQGDIVDLKTRENLTENTRAKTRLATLNQVGDERMVVFGPAEPKYTISVFTDIDCGYCRRLHSQMPQYNDLGIRVRYLFFPRSGLNTPSYDKAVSVWCADDRNDAMTRAKAGKSVEDRKCDNPVADHYNLGRTLGIRGTPFLVTESGRKLPGYVPPNELIKTLGEDKKTL